MEFQFRMDSSVTYQMTNCEKSHFVQFRDVNWMNGVECMQNTYVCSKLVFVAPKTRIDNERARRNGIETAKRMRENKEKNDIDIAFGFGAKKCRKDVSYTFHLRKVKKCALVVYKKRERASVPEQHEQRTAATTKQNMYTKCWMFQHFNAI